MFVPCLCNFTTCKDVRSFFVAIPVVFFSLAPKPHPREGSLTILAPQPMVSCADNPRQCGGTGGCAGALREVLGGAAGPSPTISTQLVVSKGIIMVNHNHHY
jgi:hypothetical protein